MKDQSIILIWKTIAVSTFPQNMADAKRNTMINFCLKEWNFTLVYPRNDGQIDHSIQKKTQKQKYYLSQLI
jgi:hypothetical protein